MDIILKYFTTLTSCQKRQLEALGSLYADWNKKINVISRKDIDSLYERHILHSLVIAKFTCFKTGSRILDVGTGGGFPGIPLAILYPDCHFLLLDSIRKKIKVVQEIADHIGLKNIEAESVRAEEAPSQFDFVVSRAVAKAKLLFQWTHQKISTKNKNDIENGFLLLKGGNLDNEMKELGKPFQEIKISEYFEEAFFDTKRIIYIKAFAC